MGTIDILCYNYMKFFIRVSYSKIKSYCIDHIDTVCEL